MHDFSNITILDHTLYFDCRTFFITMSSLGDLGLGRLAFLSSYDFGNIFFITIFLFSIKKTDSLTEFSSLINQIQIFIFFTFSIISYNLLPYV